ncbi:MAG: futalosine hydrolase [Bacteroidetes bacterium GWE2_41_25]|nr:MAG: futalosine hydrolase [Bacteroidetes bacterium GWA2_40_15]OFX98293.1 MAG: futalosine hydrolase [Bacteroidetes bacterium GWC2_40_22]OFY11419.1 MAG: futalosine hydrolase [Bacteroidetes bacterium GWE2_41_25]OFY61820.1 MAG: futalosine hydrolase [Bacteroidetes bacterium GWF2_41_9]HAM09295.1 futalosine hydrolase [Bacteroidales bacterium]
MSFKILYVAATSQEADVLSRIESIIPGYGKFLYGEYEIDILVGGVGSMSTAWSMTQWISVNEKPSLAINGGIAGSYSGAYPVGNVVMPVSDCFADAGIEDGANFLTLHETGLSDPDEFPFINGVITAENKYAEIIKSIVEPVRAITVNTSTGSEATRDKLIDKFNPDIETMEGAVFFYICAREKIPFIALRAISNMVERRNRSRWNIPHALDNLALKLEDVLKIL